MFKKDMFPKSSVKWGMKALTKGIIEPSLKLGSAAIKDISSSRRTVSTPKYYDYAIQQIGLEQCGSFYTKNIEILKTINTSSEFAAFEVLQKINVAANKYSSLTNPETDFYTFAALFLQSQANNLKTEKSKKLYKVAAEVLPLFINNAPNNNIINYIITSDKA